MERRIHIEEKKQCQIFRESIALNGRKKSLFYFRYNIFDSATISPGIRDHMGKYFSI